MYREIISEEQIKVSVFAKQENGTLLLIFCKAKFLHEQKVENRLSRFCFFLQFVLFNNTDLIKSTALFVFFLEKQVIHFPRRKQK